MFVHIVEKGDTLWKLSKKYGIPLEKIIAANPQLTNPDVIHVGEKIHIPHPGESVPLTPQIEPAPGNKPPVFHKDGHGGNGEDLAFPGDLHVTPTPSMTSIPETHPGFFPSPSPLSANEWHADSAGKWGSLWKYVVKHGDSLWKIAKQVGVTLEQLKEANPQIKNFDLLKPGDIIHIPSHGMMDGASHHLSIKEQMKQHKEKGLLPKPTFPVSAKEKMTAPKKAIPAPLQKGIGDKVSYPPHVEIPKMEVPQMEIPMKPKVEMPKMEMPKLPPVPMMHAPHLDVVQQQLYYAPHYFPSPHHPPVMVLPCIYVLPYPHPVPCCEGKKHMVMPKHPCFHPPYHPPMHHPHHAYPSAHPCWHYRGEGENSSASAGEKEQQNE